MKAITGTLFPSRFLADRLASTANRIDRGALTRQEARLPRWWARVASTCGPATSVRALFDLAAMPLFAILGFRASHASFERAACRVQLRTPRGGVVSLLVLPWASRPSSLWRSAVTAARTAGAEWCFVLAPPFLSLIGTRGSAVRRSVDFSFPGALAPECLSGFLALVEAGAFETHGPRAGCALDRLVEEAGRFQDRVRSDLQEGVLEALGVLTPAIRRPPEPNAHRPFEEALTVLYRILFLLFAESRDLVPHQHPIYRHTYALATLCRQAGRPEPARGVWDALAAITRLSRKGCRVDDLIVRPFNGRLFARAAAPTLELRRSPRRPTRDSIARDRAMQQTLVALATRPSPAGREEICYGDLGVEQLGAVYERVLDLDPETLGAPPGVPGAAAALGAPPGTIEKPAPATRSNRHSHRRKQSGTFYTPQDLAELVVRRTLGPLVAGRTADEILALRVLDPAMGSGAFLVAACRFLAAACERAFVEEGRWSEADIGPAEQARLRRLVAERCLAGVDLNPVAVQLARLSLWLATLAEGRPLGFLDHRLRVGNSVVGATPDDLHRIDQRPRGGRAGKQTGSQPGGQLPLFDDLELERSLQRAAQPLLTLTTRSDDTVDDVRAKEAIWSVLAGDRSPLAPWRRAADLWCARWFWPRANDGPPPSPAGLRAAMDALLKGDPTLPSEQLSRWLAIAAAVNATHRFFHWPLEFADIFYDAAGRSKERAGFDAVIGNPPWEMLREDGPLTSSPASLVRFIRESGLYPSCDRGHVNLYQPFLERALALTRPGGRVGLVLPWGLAADDGAAALRKRLLEQSSTEAIVGIDNAKGIFPIHRGLRFLVLVAQPGGRTREVGARFGLQTREEIAALSSEDAGGDRSSYPTRLTPELIARVSGSLNRIPDARHPGDLDLLDLFASSYPRLGASEGWNVQFGRELNATEDRAHFGDRGLVVLEGKHLTPFTVDTGAPVLRVPRATATRLLPSGGFTRARLAYRDVSGVSNRISLIAAIVPADAVTTHTLFCLRTPLPIEQQHFLCGLFNSYVLNAVVRMLMGGHLTTSLVETLPVPGWTGSRHQRLIARLAARLAKRSTATPAHALLQGAVARLYGMDRRGFEMLLERFPLVPAEDRRLAIAAHERLETTFAL